MSLPQGRPPKPEHRRLKTIKHGTLQGYYEHKNFPDIHGLPKTCTQGCKKAWSEYMAGLRKQRRAERELLRSRLVQLIEGYQYDNWVRPLTTAELDACVRALRILDDQLDSKWYGGVWKGPAK